MRPKVQACTVCRVPGSTALVLASKDGDNNHEALELYWCERCHTVYLGNYSETYDHDLYAYYQDLQGRNREDIFDPLTRSSYLRVLRMFDANGEGRSILDVGCGVGGFVDAACSAGYDAEGIDLSQSAVDIASGLGLRVSKRDFFSSGIQESSKDILTLFEVIEHVPDPISFLRRSESVVKPGGLIYLTTPNFSSLDRRFLGAEWRAVHREHLTYFTPETLIAAVRSHTGLEVVFVETRNVSSELIGHFKSYWGFLTPRTQRVGYSEDRGNPTSRDLRTTLEASPSLFLLKRIANQILNWTSLGETIVLLLRRRH